MTSKTKTGKQSPYLPNTFSSTGEDYPAPRHHRGVQAIRKTVSLFVPKYEFIGLENLPDEPCILVSNHSMAAGPIAMCTRYPRFFRPWVIWHTCDRDTCAQYAREDFWPGFKPAWLFRFLAWLCKLILPSIMHGMQTIPTYRDGRIIVTFKKTVQTLNEGFDVVIFPETDEAYSYFVNGIEQGFVDVARLMPAAKRDVPFVPLYIAPRLHTMHFGTPIRYDKSKSADENRAAISAYLLQNIDALGRELPAHKPINYRREPLVPQDMGPPEGAEAFARE